MSILKRLQLMPGRIWRKAALSRLFNVWLPWAVLTVSLTATYVLWQNAAQHAEREFQAEFNFNVQETMRDIEMRMETYTLLLQGLEGLFASSKDVTRHEFHNYIDSLELERRYPGLQAIGFARIAAENERDAHIATVRKQGEPEHNLRPGTRPESATSVVYIAPLTTSNRAMLGTDLLSNPVLRVAMERARNERTTALSGKLLLQHADASDPRPHFLMFVPIFLNAPDTATNAHRPAKLIGWVYALFHANDMLDFMSAAHKEKIELAIYDGDRISAASQLAETKAGNTGKPSSPPRLKTLRMLSIAGHVWSVEVSSLPGLETRFNRNQPRFFLFAGIGASLLLTLLVQMLIHGRARAVRLASEMNSALIQSEYRWKFALEGAGEGVWDWNIETGAVFLSPNLKEMFGCAADAPDASFDVLLDAFHPEDRQMVAGNRAACLEGKAPSLMMEARLRRQDGSWMWGQIRGMVVSRNPGGKPLRIIGTLADITERHSIYESLRLSSTVFNTLNEAVVVTDASNFILSVNPAFTKITGYSPEEVLGKDPSMLSDGVKRPELVKDMWHALNTAGSWIGDSINRRKSGELYIAWLSISVVRNDRGGVTNFISAFSDISERKAIEQRTQYLAHFDPLTDLPNRALFNDRLHQALAACRRNGTHLALLFIDLDKFKPVNDTLGHAVGDMLLKEVAYRLLDSIRESDTAARIGGDEFVVVLSGIETEQDAFVVATKLLQAIEHPFQLEEHAITISASIGIAFYPEHGQTDDEILTNADNAMYLAKRSGGARIASFGQLRDNESA